MTKKTKDAKERAQTFMGASSQEGSQYFKEDDKGQRNLTDFGENSNPFKVDKLEDFDTSSYGAGADKAQKKLNVNDVRGLINQGGFDVKDVDKYAQSGDFKVAGKAQALLDRKLGRATGGGGDNDGGTGGGGTGGGGTGEGGGGSNTGNKGYNNYASNMTNKQSNNYYSDKAEKDWQQSNKAFNVDQMLDDNIASATAGMDDRYKGLKQGVHDSINYYRNRSNLTTLGIFGDIWNTSNRPSWKSPGDPSEISTTYDKDKEEN